MKLSLNESLKSKIFLIFAGIIIIFGLIYRIDLIKRSGPGGDYSTHVKAIYDLVAGKNPYEWTIATYENLENDPADKGYAYFPGILYVNTSLYIISSVCQNELNVNSCLCSSSFLMFLPQLAAFVGVALFLVLYFKKENYLAMIFSVILWSFDYYLLARHLVPGFDAVPVLLTLLALYYLEKDDVLTGFFFALAVLFKTFPIILFPLFLFKTKKLLKFLLAGFITALFFSIPFMGSINDFWIYLRGALLVHGDRTLQGRPFLFYLSFLLSIEFIRLLPFSFYSLGSIFSGWVLVSANKFLEHFKKPLLEDKYAISAIPFLSFYLLTPVLNRTYLLWGLPIFLIGGYNFFKKRNKVFLFYLLNLFYWVFCYWYLVKWEWGFHIHALL